jgi:protease-4
MTEYQPKRRKNDSIWHKIYLLVRRFFTLLGVMVFLSSFFFSYTVYKQASAIKAPPVKSNTILTFTFEEALPESLSIDNPRDLIKSRTRLHDVTKAIKKAAKDDRIKGFIARINPNEIGISQVQEIRAAIKEFKSAGKFTHIFAEDLGGTGNDTKNYYLASAFENIWLQPIGSVAITGISGQIPFFKGTLDKLGLQADMYTREDYKTAAEPMMRNAPSKENKEMTDRLLNSLYQKMVNDIAESRGFQPEYLQALIDRAPFFDQQALEAQLVTHVDYLDVMVKTAKDAVGGEDKTQLLGINAYLSRLKAEKPHAGFIETIVHKADEKIHEKSDVENTIEHTSTDTSDAEVSKAIAPETDETKKEYGNRIAIVYANGAIVSGSSDTSIHANVIGGGSVMSADDIAANIGDARKDDKVGAIVLRVDSPGGSATASETIARAVTRAREAGKPVIVSMGSAAASGGYWISASADQIVANPATLTGSIGVIVGKFVVKDMLDKIGVNVAEFNYGDNAAMWSSTSAFDEKEKQKVNLMLDQVYAAFLDRVSKGRNITVEDLKSYIAGGRVWTGQEALDIGLVDKLGDLDTAIMLAKDTLDLKDGEIAEVVQYPPEKTKFEMFVEILNKGVFFTNPMDAIMTDLLSGETLKPMNGVQAISKAPEFK